MLCCREVAGTERGRPGEVWTTSPTEMTASAAAAGHRMLPNRLHLTVGTARGARECRSAHLYESYFRGESPPSRSCSLRASMGAPEQVPGRSGIRVELRGRGSATVETGLPVLDRLLERLLEDARCDVTLEVEPGTAEAEVSEAGSALGRALTGALREGRGYGWAMMASSEALPSVALGRSDRPVVVSNDALTDARIGGLGTDVARRFLDRFTEAAGGTLHVRLLNGTDTQHVLGGLFKALG